MLLAGLSLLGLIVGFLTGLFGISGAFISTPMMILAFGIEPSTAVGCSMGLTLANGTLGVFRHRGMGNYEPKAMWPIAVAASVGTVAGFLFHHRLAEVCGDQFDIVVNTMFCVVLFPIGILVWWQSNNTGGKPLLSKFRLPLMVQLRQKDFPPVSLIVLAIVGLAIGTLKGMLGIGGGIILVPFLVLAVGLTPHRAVGTSLGMVVLSSLVGTILFTIDGHIDFVVIVAMLLGSLIGVVLGSKCCTVTTPKRLKKLLAILLFGFSTYLAFYLISNALI